MPESIAIALRTIDYGESDRIVTLLCRSGSKVRGLARGARKSRRRFGAGFDPGNRGVLRYRFGPRSDLATLEAFDDARPLTLGSDQVVGFAAASVALEAVEGLTVEEDDSTVAFGLLEGLLEALVADLDPIVCLACYLRNLLQSTGFYLPSADAHPLEPTSTDRAVAWTVLAAAVDAYQSTTGRALRSLQVLQQLAD